MANTWDWVEIRVGDVERAALFFEALFGWKVVTQEVADGTPYCIFDTGGAPREENLRRGALWLRPKGQVPGVVLYIVVSDIEGVLQKAKGLGGKVVSSPRPEGTSLIANFADPDGNVFGLWQEKGQT